MGIIPHLLMGILNLGVVAIDIMVVLIVIRFLRQWRPHPVLRAIDTAASPVVGAITGASERFWRRWGSRAYLSPKRKLALALLLLLALRMLVVAVAVLLV
jgi:hypothetical protein